MVGAPLSPIDGGKRLAPSYSRYGSVHETVGTDLSWQFAETWDLSLSHRTSDNGREYMTPTLYANTAGDYSARLISYSNRFKSSDSQLQLSGEFETGSIQHEVTAGLAYTKTRNFWSGDDYQRADIGSGNLDNPQEFSNPFYEVDYKKAATEYSRVTRTETFLSDTLHFGTDLDIVLGLRRGNLLVHNLSGGDDYDRDATTPTAAVVYRPVAWLSTYASYIESLQQGATAPASAANAFEVFDPLETQQREIGAKAEGENWSANASFFRLQRGLTYTNANNVFTQDGELRYEGLELSGKFRLSPQWLLNASAIWLDAKAEKTTGGFLDGNDIPGVADQQASLYGEYRFADLPLTITAGTRFVGQRPLDQLNQWDLDSVSLFDLGARYETQLAGNALTLRMNLDNVADEAYWVTTPESSYLQQGAPRTLKVGAQVDF
ncbi:TonB-dependent receptor [Microbulbifer taiwanensis]|uniref:TonB-dependent receptor n=1 Tax=Microbulbifer taiwanensis TaxID=986746 RepID=UPI0036227E2C